MVSVHFQGKPFNITVIQVYAPTSNAEEAEVEQRYELSHFSRVRLCATPWTAPPGFPVPGILQAKTLEWVAISFCRGSS